jgi:hypothetical protein
MDLYLNARRSYEPILFHPKLWWTCYRHRRPFPRSPFRNSFLIQSLLDSDLVIGIPGPTASSGTALQVQSRILDVPNQVWTSVEAPSPFNDFLLIASGMNPNLVITIAGGKIKVDSINEQSPESQLWVKAPL